MNIYYLFSPFFFTSEIFVKYEPRLSLSVSSVTTGHDPRQVIIRRFTHAYITFSLLVSLFLLSSFQPRSSLTSYVSRPRRESSDTRLPALVASRAPILWKARDPRKRRRDEEQAKRDSEYRAAPSPPLPEPVLFPRKPDLLRVYIKGVSKLTQDSNLPPLSCWQAWKKNS